MSKLTSSLQLSNISEKSNNMYVYVCIYICIYLHFYMFIYKYYIYKCLYKENDKMVTFWESG